MDLEMDEIDGVRIAIEGCGHGTLHAIYASVAEGCKRKNWPGIDLLIIGGDFQAVRNEYDLNCVSMPAKYRAMGDFHEYYSGARLAPYLTIFVGGNHEASNYLFELYYGGWVAPNIYYMGAANMLRFGPLRIAALSGIWKGHDYRKSHHERLPYNESDLRSIYHVREVDIRKLLQIKTQVDIGISHDWPKGVEWKGDWKQLFRFKRHLEEDARNGRLGSIAAQYVMDRLRPKWWFSAHLHCKYAAVMDFEESNGSVDCSKSTIDTSIDAGGPKNDDEIELDDEADGVGGMALNNAPKNADEIDIDLDEDLISNHHPAQNRDSKNSDEVDLDLEEESGQAAPMAIGNAPTNAQVERRPSLEEARAALPDSFRRPTTQTPAPLPPEITNKTTRFLALDKCLPGKHFLQLMNIPCDSDLNEQRPLKLEYDREWLAITRAFALDEPLNLGNPDSAVPRATAAGDYADAIEKRRMWIDEKLSDSDLTIPENFETIAPVYGGGNWNLPQYKQVREYPNPQTARFCKMLDIPNPFDTTEDEISQRLHLGPRYDAGSQSFRGVRNGNRQGGGRGRGKGRDRGQFSSR